MAASCWRRYNGRGRRGYWAQKPPQQVRGNWSFFAQRGMQETKHPALHSALCSTQARTTALQVIAVVDSAAGGSAWKGMVLKGFRLWNWEVSKAFGAGRMVPAAPEGHLAPRMLGLLPGLALKTTTELEFRNKTLQVRPGLSLA